MIDCLLAARYALGLLMRTILAGATLHARVYGEPGGVPVLLLHGLGGSSESWLEIPQRLAATHQVVAPDLRGCGRSELGTEPLTLSLLAHDQVAVLDALGARTCHLVGHSFGGVVAQELLTTFPDRIRSAVLVSTSSRVGDAASKAWLRVAAAAEERGLANAERVIARAFAPEFLEREPHVPSTLTEILANTDPRVYAQQARLAARYNYDAALADVRCPVLILQGLEDRLTAPGGAVLLSRAIPCATLELLEGVGHYLHLERPDDFVNRVRDFVRSAEQPSP